MGQYGKHSDVSHFIVDVRDQTDVVLLDVEDNAIADRISVLASPPDCWKVSPWRVHRLDDPNPGAQ